MPREEIHGHNICIELRKSRQAPEKLNLRFSSSLLSSSTAEKLLPLKRWGEKPDRAQGWEIRTSLLSPLLQKWCLLLCFFFCL